MLQRKLLQPLRVLGTEGLPRRLLSTHDGLQPVMNRELHGLAKALNTNNRRRCRARSLGGYDVALTRRRSRVRISTGPFLHKIDFSEFILRKMQYFFVFSKVIKKPKDIVYITLLPKKV